MSLAPNAELAPWQTRTGQMYLTDVEILTGLDGACVLTPRKLARGRRRENVIRLQLQQLEKASLVRSIGLDTYRITESGEQFVGGDRPLPETDGYLHLEEVLDLTDQRITEFGTIEPIHVKLVNRDFLGDPDQDYGLLQFDPDLTENRILNVQGSRITRIMREFPRADPLASQCAHWMRALVGLHLFPDANHRTGTSLLYPILEANNLAPENWPGFPGKTVLQSKLLRKLHAPVSFDKLWLKDELFMHWHNAFTRRFYRKEPPRPTPSTDLLGATLRQARNFERQV